MSATTGPRLTKYDVDFLEGKWDGVGGAAYNECYEFCLENGLCQMDGKVTDRGRKALTNYHDCGISATEFKENTE